ncbi:uncharacterized protein BDR25DRAFT_363609 [Lindgomyces ingoldianus]|uniref:Uncharacterized protein n=1 Tax=Lindgomyces ingoldianus TaxID=673940 RepID=A0ACB6Q7H3_9PLEO|nr:uncharacterized protein BDR25DRAFT_363609 [Lindgomyces ingoldianus]KAF2462776.1 hypothetical protein BDR25DRAFT_363609 [Lindgomyces ingoldianus]
MTHRLCYHMLIDLLGLENDLVWLFYFQNIEVDEAARFLALSIKVQYSLEVSVSIYSGASYGHFCIGTLKLRGRPLEKILVIIYQKLCLQFSTYNRIMSRSPFSVIPGSSSTPFCQFPHGMAVIFSWIARSSGNKAIRRTNSQAEKTVMPNTTEQRKLSTEYPNQHQRPMESNKPTPLSVAVVPCDAMEENSLRYEPPQRDGRNELSYIDMEEIANRSTLVPNQPLDRSLVGLADEMPVLSNFVAEPLQ